MANRGALGTKGYWSCLKVFKFNFFKSALPAQTKQACRPTVSLQRLELHAALMSGHLGFWFHWLKRGLPSLLIAYVFEDPATRQVPPSSSPQASY